MRSAEQIIFEVVLHGAGRKANRTVLIDLEAFTRFAKAMRKASEQIAAAAIPAAEAMARFADSYSKQAGMLFYRSPSAPSE